MDKAIQAKKEPSLWQQLPAQFSGQLVGPLAVEKQKQLMKGSACSIWKYWKYSTVQSLMKSSLIP